MTGSQEPQELTLPSSGILAVESRHSASFRMDPQYHSFHEVFLLLRGAVVVRLYHRGAGRGGGEGGDSHRPGDGIGGGSAGGRGSNGPRAETEVEERGTGEVAERHMQPGDYLLVPAGIGHTIHDSRSSTLVLIACTDQAIDAVPGRREIWRQILGSAPFPQLIRSAPLHLRDPSWRELIALTPRTGGSRSGPRSGRPSTDSPRTGPLSGRPHSDLPRTSATFSGSSASGRLEIENAFSRFLLELKRLTTRPRFPDARERIQVFAGTLPPRAHEPWTLDRAAGEVYLSRRRFSELWRATTGETFINSLQQLRVATAQQMMVQDHLSIAGAAFAAGFDDVTHFYRVFHKHVGMPPGTWIARQS